jgi:hypothetical protein
MRYMGKLNKPQQARRAMHESGEDKTEVNDKPLTDEERAEAARTREQLVDFARKEEERLKSTGGKRTPPR